MRPRTKTKRSQRENELEQKSVSVTSDYETKLSLSPTIRLVVKCVRVIHIGKLFCENAKPQELSLSL